MNSKAPILAAPAVGEFDLIQRYFAPLAAGEPLALGLRDDAALIRPREGFDLTVTVDGMVAGVHFFADDPPDLIARKLLRVNLSDLAAMGARPLGYLLVTAFERGVSEDWIAGFAAGLAADQHEFNVSLLGGDTVATPGPMTFTLTAVGEVGRGRALRRAGAQPGDLIYVSGSIGDAALGLALRRGELASASLDPAATDYLLNRHRLPVPRLALGQALVDRASAAVDVSDGLVADLGHICTASGVGAEIEAAAVPLSPAAAGLVARQPERLAQLLSGGDDYELCFCLPAAAAPALAALAETGGVPLRHIGRIVGGDGVVVTDAAGRAMTFAAGGFTHF